MPEAVEESYEEIEESGPSSIRDLQRKMRLEGTVTRVELFGAFVDVGVGTDGLVHISQIADKRIEKVADYLEMGQEVKVKVLEIDRQGRVRLSMKEAVETPAEAETSAPEAE